MYASRVSFLLVVVGVGGLTSIGVFLRMDASSICTVVASERAPSPVVAETCTPSPEPLHEACIDSYRAYLQEAVDWTFHQERQYALPDISCANPCDIRDATRALGFALDVDPALAYLALLEAIDYDRVADDEGMRAAIDLRLGLVAPRAAAEYLERGIERDAAIALNVAETTVTDPAAVAEYREASSAFDRAFPKSTRRFEHHAWSRAD